jgi:hypothetical protein
MQPLMVLFSPPTASNSTRSVDDDGPRDYCESPNIFDAPAGSVPFQETLCISYKYWYHERGLSFVMQKNMRGLEKFYNLKHRLGWGRVLHTLMK